MMKISAAALIATALLTSGWLASKGWANRDKPAPAGAVEDGQLRMLSYVNDLEMYYVKYDGHSCFVAKSRGGGGVGIQCAR